MCTLTYPPLFLWTPTFNLIFCLQSQNPQFDPIHKLQSLAGGRTTAQLQEWEGYVEVYQHLKEILTPPLEPYFLTDFQKYLLKWILEAFEGSTVQLKQLFLCLYTVGIGLGFLGYTTSAAPCASAFQLPNFVAIVFSPILIVLVIFHLTNIFASFNGIIEEGAERNEYIQHAISCGFIILLLLYMNLVNGNP